MNLQISIALNIFLMLINVLFAIQGSVVNIFAIIFIAIITYHLYRIEG